MYTLVAAGALGIFVQGFFIRMVNVTLDIPTYALFIKQPDGWYRALKKKFTRL